MKARREKNAKEFLLLSAIWIQTVHSVTVTWQSCGLTRARFFVAWVPRRSAAFCCTTDAQMRSVLTRPPKTSSFKSNVPTVSLFEF